MGNNTVAFLLNDFASEIERRPKDVITTISRALSGGCGAEMGQALKVLPSVHADGDQVIMAGGNRITTIALFIRCDHTEDALMRALAKKLGYSIKGKTIVADITS